MIFKNFGLANFQVTYLFCFWFKQKNSLRSRPPHRKKRDKNKIADEKNGFTRVGKWFKTIFLKRLVHSSGKNIYFYKKLRNFAKIIKFCKKSLKLAAHYPTCVRFWGCPKTVYNRQIPPAAPPPKDTIS